MSTAKSEKRKEEEQWDKWNARLRELGLYFFGIYLAYNEFLVEPIVRIPAVIFIASVLSIPMVTRLDETLRKRNGGSPRSNDQEKSQ